MTLEGARKVLSSAFNIVKNEIDAGDGGDRPISPPAWKLKLESDLRRVRNGLTQETLSNNLWIVESLQELIHEPVQVQTARHVRSVFQSWRSEEIP